VLADMHAHYPMHVEQGGPFRTVEAMRRFSDRPFLDKARAAILQLASRWFSDENEWSGDRVTIPLLYEGEVRLVFSVLYSPADEVDVWRRYPHAPMDEYFTELLAQLGRVEEDLTGQALDPNEPGIPLVVKNSAALDNAQETGAIAMVHCVEGGFHLGSTPATIEANVATLADKGVAYITIAHLFWRKVATNVNALPFIRRDWLYHLIWPQPPEGLSELGQAAVRAMAQQGILVDVSHMSEAALDETFALLDDIAPGMPVIASHAGYRFGRQPYMLAAATVRRIAERNGVIGLIMAQHQLNDGIRRSKTTSFEESVDVICRHIDRIADITGSHDHVALGTDLDGFIKPTMAGIDNASYLPNLRQALLDRGYPEAVVDGFAYGNAEGVLREVWAWRQERLGSSS
jgi:microsomal dipeptidase-like Zn-dependent dipeptidase